MKTLMLFCFATLPLFLLSQKETKTWVTTQKETIEGKITKLNDSSILFTAENQSYNFSIQEIEKVRFIRKNSTTRSGIAGAAVGMGIGLIIGSILDSFPRLGFQEEEKKEKSNVSFGTTIAGGLGGLIFGLAIGSDPGTINIGGKQKKYKRNKKRLKKLIGTEG